MRIATRRLMVAGIVCTAMTGVQARRVRADDEPPQPETPETAAEAHPVVDEESVEIAAAETAHEEEEAVYHHVRDFIPGLSLELGPSWYPEIAHGETALHVNLHANVIEALIVTVGGVVGLPVGLQDEPEEFPWIIGGHVLIGWLSGHHDSDVRMYLGAGGFRYHLFEGGDTVLATTGGMLQIGFTVLLTHVVEFGITGEVGYGLCEEYRHHEERGCVMLGITTGLHFNIIP